MTTQTLEDIKIRDTKPFLIDDVNTDNPITDVLMISSFLDTREPLEKTELTERYFLELFYNFTSNSESIVEENASEKFLAWFNTDILEKYLQQMTEDEFKSLEAWFA